MLSPVLEQAVSRLESQAKKPVAKDAQRVIQALADLGATRAVDSLTAIINRSMSASSEALEEASRLRRQLSTSSF